MNPLDRYTEGLNPEQTTALMASGTTLLVACAGSGKTRVLTRKVAKLIDVDGYDPNRIMALTFTNKAANEMLERLAGPDLLARPLDRNAVDSPWISTIHSAFYRMLSEDLPYVDRRYSPRLAVLDDSRAKIMIEGILKDFGYKEEDAEYNPLAIIKQIADARAAGFRYDQSDTQELMLGEDADEMMVLAYRIWGPYIEKKLAGDPKTNAKYVDFVDMIDLTVDMFRNHPQTREKWAGRYDYLLVDEFQDTDVVQAEGIRMLSAGHNNLFCVGDPRQLIYEWRGAAIQLTTKFTDFFANGSVLHMSHNYRSMKAVVDFGNVLIRHANFEVTDAVAVRQDMGDVSYLGHFANDDEEAAEVVGTIKAMLDSGRQPGDFAVLYRINALSAALEDHLMRAEIPYVVQGSTGFYAREEIKDILAYLHVLYEIRTTFADKDTRMRMNALLVGKYGFETEFGSFERIINRPNRYLGKAFIREWANNVRYGNDPLKALNAPFSKSYMSRNARDFASTLLQLTRVANESKIGDTIRDLRKMLDYDRWISRAMGDSVDSPKVDNLDTLCSRVDDFSSLKALLVYATAAAKPEETNGAAVQSVKLMTVHRSKGLEFPVVFVVGASDGILPHSRAITSEEERRIMYVALTRAMDTAFISGCAEFGSREGMSPSPFLDEMGVGSLNESPGEDVKSFMEGVQA